MASRKTIITCDSGSMCVNIIMVGIKVGKKGHTGCKNSEPYFFVYCDFL